MSNKVLHYGVGCYCWYRVSVQLPEVRATHSGIESVLMQPSESCVYTLFHFTVAAIKYDSLRHRSMDNRVLIYELEIRPSLEAVHEVTISAH